MGKIKQEIDKLSGTYASSRTAGDALSKLTNITAENVEADEATVGALEATTITIGESTLDATKLAALLALLD